MNPERERITLYELIRKAVRTWHGVKLNQPDWSDDSHSIALCIELADEGLLFHLILNAYWEPLDFELPGIGDDLRMPWRRWIDTSLDTPHDIVEWQLAFPVPGSSYRAQPRSTVVLIAGGEPFRRNH